ncbi:MAG: acid--CoA ligase [Candidatus Aminicenantes bacterium]|nr:acid--CoA ligase [Candidatus Aminicenantes bacterium]
MRVTAFLTDCAVVNRIIKHLKLTFVAVRPPTAHIVYQELFMAAKERSEWL